MKTPILLGICSVILLGASETRAKDAVRRDQSPSVSAANNKPGKIACAQESGESLGHCTYRVKRDKNGKITVTVGFANGFKRKLFFKDGRFTKASTTMSGTGTDTDWNLTDGVHKIRVDDQRFEVPDALIESHQ